ncbi:MAG: hypothetical protein WD002_01970 [Pseudomonadales bacterium]
MNQNQFRKLLETYGANEANWPAESISSARVLIGQSEAAARLLLEFRAFDEALDRYQVEIDAGELSARILATVPFASGASGATRLVDRILDWLIPESTNLANLWRPAIAATFPLLLGVVLGSTISLNGNDLVDNWQDEIYLLALASEETEPLP